MGLDESLFRRLHNWWTKRRHRAVAATELSLEADQARWQCLLHLLGAQRTGLDLVLGDARSRSGESVALPASLPLGPSPDETERVLILRLALATAADDLTRQGVLDCDDTAPDDHAGAAQALQVSMPSLTEWLAREWPETAQLVPTAERYEQHLRDHGTPEHVAFLMTYGALPRRGREQRAATSPPQHDDVTADSLPQGTERRQKRRGDVEVVEQNERDDGNNPLAHTFEKVHTAEEHTGGNRSIDGSDELDGHLEALEDLDLRRVLRTHQKTSSVFRAEVDFASTTGDLRSEEPPPSAQFTYDEWDARNNAYRPGWCAVAETRAPLPTGDDSWREQLGAVRNAHAATTRRLRGEFARLMRGSTYVRRQPVGSDIDIDAIVDHHGDVRAASDSETVASEPRLYLQRRPAPREVAVSVLFDRSLSSDSWVNDQRVLSVTRQAVIVLGEALQAVRLPVEIGAFCSHTRRDCRHALIKAFDEGWSNVAPRLFHLEPDGYTRIGPALRHATARLAKRPARRRLLIVISDCKPVDYDHYEGRHGIADVRQAIREAQSERIDTMALSIDSRAGPHLAAMFGRSGFKILPNAAQLARVLAHLHEQLLRR